MVQVSYNISAEAKEIINKLAKKHKRSMSKEVDYMIVNFVEK